MEKILNVSGMKISYMDEGAGKTVLLLHGWGVDQHAFDPLRKQLKEACRVVSLDWPGFGGSPEPQRPWAVQDYQLLLEDFIEALKLESIHVVAHSFGGRVAIKWAAQDPASLDKMILVGSAGIRPKRSLQWYVKVYVYKFGKKAVKFPLLGPLLAPWLGKKQAKAGSEDYRRASVLMKQTMSRVVQEDLQGIMPQIKAPTLLVWGDQDQATPLQDGERMEKLIPGAGLAVFQGAGHYAYLDQLPRFVRVLRHFFQL